MERSLVLYFLVVCEQEQKQKQKREFVEESRNEELRWEFKGDDF